MKNNFNNQENGNLDTEQELIEVYGARVHNLKNIDIKFQE
jgi:hypothetical protein